LDGYLFAYEVVGGGLDVVGAPPPPRRAAAHAAHAPGDAAGQRGAPGKVDAGESDAPATPLTTETSAGDTPHRLLQFRLPSS
jgi:hypothetical protein